MIMNLPRKRKLKRHAVLEFICRYKLEHAGNSPSYAEIAREFNITPDGARSHIYWLIIDNLIDIEDRMIVVKDSEWVPPGYFSD